MNSVYMINRYESG